MKKQDILKSKKTNSLLICGTGQSIKENREKVIKYANRFDSIGMDWFCKSKITTKYYFIRDQVHHSSMVSLDDKETVSEFSSLINDYYKNSILLISKLRMSDYDDFGSRWDWGSKHARLYANKVIIPEFRSYQYRDMKEDFLGKCFRYSYDLFCILQFAQTMKYDHVVLAGFDLNNNYCFWKDDLRLIQRKRGIELTGESVEYYPFYGMLNYFKNYFHKKIFSLDKNSKLLENNFAIYLKN